MEPVETGKEELRKKFRDAEEATVERALFFREKMESYFFHPSLITHDPIMGREIFFLLTMASKRGEEIFSREEHADDELLLESCVEEMTALAEAECVGTREAWNERANAERLRRTLKIQEIFPNHLCFLKGE